MHSMVGYVWAILLTNGTILHLTQELVEFNLKM